MSEKPPLNVFLLTSIIVGTILSIRNWPFLVEYGFSSVVYLLLAALIFFLPVSFVSAELASGWPQRGGIYVWVREALGEKFAFLAVWLLWIANVVWYPTILSFITATLLSAFAPHMTHNPYLNVALMLALFWGILIPNFAGIRYSGWFSAITLIAGTLIPGAAIIAFGGIWLASGNPSQIVFSLESLIPKETHLNELIFFVGVLLSFFGMEMNAVHAKDVANPKKNFPRAIFLSAVLITILFIFGTLSIGVAIPKEKINLVTAVMEAISHYLNAWNLGWLLPIFSLMIAFGACGGISIWLVGSSKTLLIASESGRLPPFMCRTNQHGVPTPILVLQGIIVSGLTFVFFAMPNTSSAFWVLNLLSSQLNLLMYAFMFIAAIALRYKHPDVHRFYTIPGGNWGMWTMSGLGLVVCLFCFSIGFIPPAQIHIGSLVFYESFLIFAILIFCAVPFFLFIPFVKIKVLKEPFH